MQINFYQIVEEFGLGEYVTHEALADGNVAVYKLVTSAGVYFLKQVEDVEAVGLYREVERTLNAWDVRQARLYLRPDGGCVSVTGFAVYEFLEGDASYEINDYRLESLMVYLGRFNEALGHIAVPQTVTDNSNPWKKADSLEYLFGLFKSDIADVSISNSTRLIIADTLAFLKAKQKALDKLSKQLIHGDIGPGNILYAGDSVVSVIDFTPMCGAGLYALCHFFY